METTTATWTRFYRDTFQELDYPILLADEKLSFLWANTAAERFMSPLPAEQVFGQFIFSHCISTIFDKFHDHQTITLPMGGPVPALYQYRLTPVIENEKLLGCTVTLVSLQPNGSPLRPEGLERSLATFSHQTRNPLNQIFLSLTGLANCNETLESPDIREYVSKISTQCYRLLRTSMNLTEIQRFAHGPATFSPKRQDLVRFLTSTCEQIGAMMKRAGIQFSSCLPQGPLYLLFEAERISCLLLHLLSNAAKFLGEEGGIQLELSATDKYAIVTITDNGLGIQSDILPRVFEPYFSHDPHTGGICGDGLGLTLCKAIVEQHGGAITINSTEMEGTRVAFSLSLAETGGTPYSVSEPPSMYMDDRFSVARILLSDILPPPDFATRYH